MQAKISCLSVAETIYLCYLCLAKNIHHALGIVLKLVCQAGAQDWLIF